MRTELTRNFALKASLLLLKGGAAREKTDQHRSSLAHCVGHYLGPLQLPSLSHLSNLPHWPYSASLPACCKYFVSRFIFSFLTTDFIVFFSVPNTFFRRFR